MWHLIQTGVCLLLVVAKAIITAAIYGLQKLILGKDTVIHPQLFYKESDFQRYLLENCSALSRVFKPPWWMTNGHAQTIVPVFLPKTPMEYKREIMKLSDGGQLALDWAQTGIENVETTSPVCLILPGLAGDALGYTNLAKCAMEKGFRPVVFNKRGHGNCPITTPKLQSFGDPTDFKEVIEFVGRRYPNAKLTAVGISAGSGLLVSYLGEEVEKTALAAAVGLSPGYDTYKLFNESLGPPYDYLLLRGLRKIIVQQKSVLSEKFDLTHTLASTRVHEIEERLYCKIYDFKTISDYWANNNPMRSVENVRTPILIVSSKDDPVVPEVMIPFSMFQKNDYAMLLALEKGGHCGFIEEKTMTNCADQVAVDYIASVLTYNGK